MISALWSNVRLQVGLTEEVKSHGMFFFWEDTSTFTQSYMTIFNTNTNRSTFSLLGLGVLTTVSCGFFEHFFKFLQIYCFTSCYARVLIHSGLGFMNITDYITNI